jgi:phosphate transport system substrate-binding protein
MLSPFVRALFGALCVLAVSTAAEAAVRLSETGSTLLYPIITVWIKDFGAMHPDVRIDSAATGSGTGIRAAIAGTAELGASDAYLSDAQILANGVINIPLAVSAQEVVYNVPELRGGPALNLSGPVLAGIYDGDIRWWDDSKIAALNAGLQLPHHLILPVHRSDASGDTYIFTQYLSLSTPAWDSAIHYGTGVHWPKNPKALEGIGNDGVIDFVSRASYGLGYIGISYAERARFSGLDVAALQNRNGAFVLPTTAATRATARAMADAVPSDGRLAMIYTAGAKAYPLVNFEYAIVKSTQKRRGRAAALRDFLTWIVSPALGNGPALLETVHFAPLPDRVRAIAVREIATITGP